MKYIDKKTEIISYIYQLRVLSYSEIYDYFFKSKGLAEGYCNKIVKEMVNNKLLEKFGKRKTNSYYFITNNALKMIKENGLKLIGSDKSSTASLIPAHRIKIDENLINHQLNLNHFVLEYEARSEIPFNYYDEKFVSQVFPGARPDGLIREGNRVLFLEMDMNTEDKRALNKKWENYRKLFMSESFYNMKENALIVFIQGGNMSNKSKRSSFLRKQIDNNLGDFIGPKLNAVIDSEEKLLAHLFTKDHKDTISRFTAMGYNVYKGSTNQESLSGCEFTLYINRTDDKGKIIDRQGVYDEFLVDDITDGNLYSFRKISNYDSILSKFKFIHKRNLKYIVISESESEAYRTALDTGNFNFYVYYTTPSRLSSLPLHEALFQIDSFGEKWHFSGPDLRIRVDEEKVFKTCYIY